MILQWIASEYIEIFSLFNGIGWSLLLIIFTVYTGRYCKGSSYSSEAIPLLDNLLSAGSCYDILVLLWVSNSHLYTDSVLPPVR